MLLLLLPGRQGRGEGGLKVGVVGRRAPGVDPCFLLDGETIPGK